VTKKKEVHPELNSVIQSLQLKNDQVRGHVLKKTKQSSERVCFKKRLTAIYQNRC